MSQKSETGQLHLKLRREAQHTVEDHQDVIHPPAWSSLGKSRRIWGWNVAEETDKGALEQIL